MSITNLQNVDLTDEISEVEFNLNDYSQVLLKTKTEIDSL